MSDRRINLVLSAIDTGSPVVSRFASNVKRSAKDVSDANRAIYGPARAPRFDNAEQAVRDRLAGVRRAQRESQRRELLNAEVHNRLLSKTAIEGAGDASGPVFGPKVRERFDAEERAVRSGLARVKAAERSERRQQLIDAEVHNRRLSETAIEGAADTGMIHGPARRPRFDAATAAQRTADAAMTREIRSGASRDIAEATRRRSLLGDSDLLQNGFAGREFMRGASAGGARGSARLSEAEAGLYKRIKENTDGLEKTLKVVRGIGAIGAVTESARLVGEGLEKLPEVTHEYHEALKHGANASEFWATKLADTIPGAGQLAKGIRAVFDSGNYLAQKAKDEYKQQQDERSAIQKKAAEREKGRQDRMRPLLEGADVADVQARGAARLFMTRGNERQRVEAQLAYEEKVRQIGHETLTGPDLTAEEQQRVKERSPEERARLEASAKTRLAQAARERTEAMYNIDRDASQRQAEQEYAQQDRLFEIKSQGGQRDLQLSGYYASARLAAIRDENQQAITELGRRYHEETKDLKDGSQEKIAAERRYRDELVALRGKGYAEETAEREQTRRADAASDRAFARTIEGMRAETIAARLRAAGAGEDAEKIQRAEAHRQRLADIDDQEREAKEKRGEWYARGGADQFRQQRAAENDTFAASEAAARQEREKQFLPSLFGSGGTASQGLSGAVSAGAIEARLNFKGQEDKAAAEVKKMNANLSRQLAELIGTLKGAGTLTFVKAPSGI